MINLKFLRIWGVFERTSQELLQKWYGRIREGLVQGVHVDLENARVKIPCEVLESGELAPWVKTTEKPNWFLLSLMVPGPNWLGIVGEGKKIAPHLDHKTGKWLLKFRNATVIRFYGRKLVADYLAVARQNSKWFLIQKERAVVDVPYHVNDKESLRQFLQDEVESDILEVAVELFNPNALPNQQWQKELQEAVKVAPPQKQKPLMKPQQPQPRPQPQPQPKVQQPQPQPKVQLPQPESQPKSNPQPKPIQPIQHQKEVEEVETQLPIVVAPIPKAKKTKVVEKERPPKRKRPPVEADDDAEKEIQLARKGNWRDLLN
jgi:hypothetical protein